MKVYKKHVLIVGSARSGTSWFSELMAQPFRYRLLFEPEHEDFVEEGKYISDRWITEANNPKVLEKYLKRVFANRVDSDWIAQNSNRKWKRHLWPFVPKRFVIKMVRGNLAAPFLYDHFRMPTIKVIRNPYNVVFSQNRSRFPWLFNMENFKQQPELLQLLKEEYDFSFEQKEFSKLEILTIRWCIENLEIFNPKPIASVPYLFVKYEDLIGNVDLFKSICKQFNMEPIANIDEVYTRPSSKTHPKSTIRSGAHQKPKFAPEEYQEINRILDVFRMDQYDRKSS